MFTAVSFCSKGPNDFKSEIKICAVCIFAFDFMQMNAWSFLYVFLKNIYIYYNIISFSFAKRVVGIE